MNFTLARTGHHHHHGGVTTESDDGAGEDTEDLMTMPLFERSEPHNINTTSTTTDTSSSSIPVHLIEKEHMFDKVVTPSDVGKLNRLVIPKQHAERYFPLDSSTNEKGLLLNFEDRNGKPWRFRYSYWNSSQSYVMTKGWSRFVKEKKLDAGDTVSFQRGLGEFSKDRLFIDWTHRPDAPELIIPPSHVVPLHHHQFSYHHRSLNPWNTNNPMFLQPFPHPHHYHNYGYNNSTIVNGNPCPPGSVLYLRPGVGARNEAGFINGPQQNLGMLQLQRSGGVRSMVNSCNEQQEMVFDSVPVVQGKAAAKRLRLFGVNMDCPVSELDGCDKVLSSTAHQAIMPMFGNFGGFDSSSSLPTSSSVPSRASYYRSSYDDHEDGDKGKGNSKSLDLDI